MKTKLLSRLSELYKRFRAWQVTPHRFVNIEPGEHTCANCGNKYEGNFCPVCGQKYDIEARATWKSVSQDLMRVTGRETSSLLGTLTQLLGRPGYLINDYINGRRQSSYSPVSILFFFSIVVYIEESLLGHIHLQSYMGEGGDFMTLEVLFQWLGRRLAWLMIGLTAFLIVPTWLLFRHAPRNPRHSLTAGIYIQFFMSSIVLLVIFITDLTTWKLAFLIPIYYFFAFRQLFGYSVWGTAWRTLLIILEGAILALIVLFGAAVVVGDVVTIRNPWAFYISAVLKLLLMNGVLLLAAYLIGRFGEKRRR